MALGVNNMSLDQYLGAESSTHTRASPTRREKPAAKKPALLPSLLPPDRPKSNKSVRFVPGTAGSGG